VPQHRGLIEQVLDRQEQVEDWQGLDERWRDFVDEVIERGKCLPRADRLPSEQVFVIMIDDCDLQVERIRELLPALRILYHPRVFFIVSADQGHMTDMLALSFYGQQNVLAKHRNTSEGHVIELVQTDRWAVDLARASVNKVFPLKNRWKLRSLALFELLAFPRYRKNNLKVILDGWPQQKNVTKEREWGSLGTYLQTMAGTSEDPVELPPIMPYRAAHQIVEQALAQNDQKQSALEAIRHILGRYDSDQSVKISRRRKQGKNAATDDPDPTIEFLATGELTALFHEGFREPPGTDEAVVLSARPAFAFGKGAARNLLSMTGSAGNDAQITSALIAASLRDDGYGVVAPGLVWNIHLALAWTEARVIVDDRSFNFAFQWPVYIHPSPLQLLLWTKDWRNFIHDLSGNAELRLERIAYAWIYYQLKWMLKDLDSDLNIPDPFKAQVNEEPSWKNLLKLVPETGTEKQFWRTRRLPLLARPELGLPRHVQQFVLENVRSIDTEWLRDQRRRRITDAIIAAAYQGNASAEGAENQKLASRVADLFEERHQKIEGLPSPWWNRVEKPPASARKRTSPLR
jgi:hypothetical protein